MFISTSCVSSCVSSVGQEVYRSSHRSAGHHVHRHYFDLCVSKLHGGSDLPPLPPSSSTRSSHRSQYRQRLGQVQRYRPALPRPGVGDVHDVVCRAAVDVDDDFPLAYASRRVTPSHDLSQGHRLVNRDEAVEDVGAPLAAVFDEEFVARVAALDEAVENAYAVGEGAATHTHLGG